MDLEKVSALIESEWSFFKKAHSRWSLTAGPQDMELVAHAMRVILHMGKAGESLPEVLALVAAQHADGGWGRESQEKDSAAWVSAFCGLMLIRGNAVLEHPGIEESVWKSIDYFLRGQKADGRWVDSEWGDLDTTSHPVSFFNVVLALGTSKMKEAVRASWRKGLRFILDNQSQDGGWYDPVFQPSGVETTAHLVQDAVIASLVLPEGLPVRPNCEKGLRWILEHQAEDGSWDDHNVDHTMDCTRSSLLITRMLRAEEKAASALEKAIEWIVQTKNENGWPDFPGMETNLERTCDGLDVLLKYQAWKQADPQEVVRRWGYVPGHTQQKGGVVSPPLAKATQQKGGVVSPPLAKATDV
ncbi:MAG: terpene cyclase/mutase family protein [Candidatus Omnitrophica bacterium]|nr:terpene cyclase/mutase family protein [Candidatus Omnitrophota bacterium]